MDPYDVPTVKRYIRKTTTFLNSTWRKLQEARAERGWTIEDTAEKINVDPSTYQRWESGRQRPRLAHLLALLDVFGLQGILDEEDIAFVRSLAQLDWQMRKDIIDYVMRKDEGGSIMFLWWLKHFEELLRRDANN